jgi:hypothetical protein
MPRLLKSKFGPLCLATLGLACCMAGCGQKAKPADAAKPLQQSFQSAEAPVQQAIASATSSLKAGNYAEATRALAPLATKPDLTAEQRQAMGTALRQINQAMAANPKLNTKEMYEMRQKLFQAAYGKPRP